MNCRKTTCAAEFFCAVWEWEWEHSGPLSMNRSQLLSFLVFGNITIRTQNINSSVCSPFGIILSIFDPPAATRRFRMNMLVIVHSYG